LTHAQFLTAILATTTIRTWVNCRQRRVIGHSVISAVPASFGQMKVEKQNRTGAAMNRNAPHRFTRRAALRLREVTGAATLLADHSQPAPAGPIAGPTPKSTVAPRLDVRVCDAVTSLKPGVQNMRSDDERLLPKVQETQGIAKALLD
jgi:hypothetical protein